MRYYLILSNYIAFLGVCIMWMMKMQVVGLVAGGWGSSFLGSVLMVMCAIAIKEGVERVVELLLVFWDDLKLVSSNNGWLMELHEVSNVTRRANNDCVAVHGLDCRLKILNLFIAVSHGREDILEVGEFFKYTN